LRIAATSIKLCRRANFSQQESSMERSLSFSTAIFAARTAFKVFYFLVGLAWLAAGLAPAQATIGREQDIVDLKLGQRVRVDDGTCPAGQIKEVSGSKMTESGVVRVRKCVPRFGPKMKPR
jgi:uncharacterized protein DUF6719